VSVNTYETVFIAEPEISNDQVDQFIAKIKQTITAKSGTLTGEDRWGRRRLAYPIHGHREGYYAVLNFTAETDVVNALEHLYNVTDSVIRHLTVRVIKKNKTFRPRRERPAGGHADSTRHTSRSPGGFRPRSEGASHATPPAVGGGAKPAPAPVAAEPLPAEQPGAVPAHPAGETPEGGTPS
jgi:small subunit ribosomal protein S6